jgi:acetate kinase
MKKELLILVLNSGSSSLKFSLFHDRSVKSGTKGGKNGGKLDLQLAGAIQKNGKKNDRDAWLHAADAAGNSLAKQKVTAVPAQWTEGVLRFIEAWLSQHFPGRRLIVGHRVVHGGTTFHRPVKVGATVLRQLEKVIPLDPLHLPVNLAAIRAVRKWNTALPQVACFDTAFHQTHPPVASLSAIPLKYYEAGVRRYGFHGLSYEYVASVLPKIAPGISRGRVVVAHLGSGASLCALKAGRSQDSTMGFSVLDGIPMGTRPGRLDPGIILYLLRQGMTTTALESFLYHECGLLGLSGLSSDMRLLETSRRPRARLAVEYFVHRIAQEIAALASSLGGLDGLVFTGGIGEHSPIIRAAVVRACAWLGLELDAQANRTGGPRLSTGKSRVSAWVIRTNEELVIARHAAALFKSPNKFSQAA